MGYAQSFEVEPVVYAGPAVGGAAVAEVGLVRGRLLASSERGGLRETDERTGGKGERRGCDHRDGCKGQDSQYLGEEKEEVKSG